MRTSVLLLLCCASPLWGQTYHQRVQKARELSARSHIPECVYLQGNLRQQTLYPPYGTWEKPVARPPVRVPSPLPTGLATPKDTAVPNAVVDEWLNRLRALRDASLQPALGIPLKKE